MNPRATNPSPDRPAVDLENVSRRYSQGSASVAALAGVSLRIARAEFVAVMGPSGCGKSTLLNLMSAVDVCDAGRAVVCGVDLGAADERTLTNLRRRQIGVVFQAFHLMPHLSVEENVALPLALAGRTDPDRVRDLIERVGLSQRSAHQPAELSGGEKQRVAVARALVHRPELVVADEPTGNLDSLNGARVLELLTTLQREEGAALVLATHDDRIAARADRIVHLLDGQQVDGAL